LGFRLVNSSGRVFSPLIAAYNFVELGMSSVVGVIAHGGDAEHHCQDVAAHDRRSKAGAALASFRFPSAEPLHRVLIIAGSIFGIFADAYGRPCSESERRSGLCAGSRLRHYEALNLTCRNALFAWASADRICGSGRRGVVAVKD
jgi:hypothetical protein